MSLTDFAPDAHRLAMELECLLLDCADTRAVSKWWDSANEALDQHRAFCATIEAEATKPQEPCLIHLYSSAVCSRGTKGCSVEHTTPQPCQGCQDWAKRWNKVMDEVDESRKPCKKCLLMGADLKAIDAALGDPRVNLTITTSQAVTELKAKCAELESYAKTKPHLYGNLEAEARRIAKRLDTTPHEYTIRCAQEILVQQAERIKELEAEDSAVQLLKDRTINQQAERIIVLEAGVLNKDGMALVTKEDANNYCRILTLLGMEEEGSPVEEVKRLISLHEGMTCGDCNDTGWLENREEGRYPCTCMTEAEPYQLLEAERDALAITVQQMREALKLWKIASDNSEEVEFDEMAAYSIPMPLFYDADEATEAALALSDTSSIIKRHDAELFKTVLGVFDTMANPDLFRTAMQSAIAKIAAEIGASL